jgi:hypothetical protein
MGGILEGVEALKSPVGILVILLIIGAGYMYYRYIFKEEPKEPEKRSESK